MRPASPQSWCPSPPSNESRSRMPTHIRARPSLQGVFCASTSCAARSRPGTNSVATGPGARPTRVSAPKSRAAKRSRVQRTLRSAVSDAAAAPDAAIDETFTITPARSRAAAAPRANHENVPRTFAIRIASKFSSVRASRSHAAPRGESASYQDIRASIGFATAAAARRIVSESRERWEARDGAPRQFLQQAFGAFRALWYPHTFAPYPPGPAPWLRQWPVLLLSPQPLPSA